MTTHIQTPSDELQYGTKLNNYVIQSVLGRGAFGITYLAIDNLDRQVAIKEYLPVGFSKRDKRHTVSPLTEDNYELFKYGLDCFLDEAKTVVKFNHPNIVRVLAFFEENQTAYMVMEYEIGQDLKAYLKQSPPLSERRLLEIFCPINDGLIKVHKRGYIHRDIKPANIYIRKDSSPVLLDFGAARDVFNSKIDQLTRILTPGYAPYEQDNPSWADQGSWTDIYSLGATLYYAMLDHRMIAAQERATAIMLKTDDPYLTVKQQLHGHYSNHFLTAIDHALAFHPTDRPQSVNDWNTELLGKNRSDEDKTAILLVGRVHHQNDDRTQVSPTSITEVTVEMETPTPLAIKTPISVKAIHAKNTSSKKIYPKNPISLIATQTINFSAKWLITVGIFFAVIVIYVINTDTSNNQSTFAAEDNTSQIAKTNILLKDTPNTADATTIVTKQTIITNHGIISSKVDTAFTHLISASEFYMRANIKQKAIEDFERENIQVSSKIMTTLKLQHDQFMNKFKYHLDTYIKNMLDLRQYNADSVSRTIKDFINSSEHINKPIHISLSDFFASNINSTTADDKITLEQNLKDLLNNIQ